MSEEKVNKEYSAKPASLNWIDIRDSNDRIQLASVFPDLVWLLVVDKLQDEPWNIMNIWKTSSYFHNLLQSYRVVFLFPDVWEILGTKYEKEHAYNPAYNEAMRKIEGGGTEATADHDDEGDDAAETASRVSSESFEEDMSTRWFSGILKLRLVCRTWSAALDEFYQTLPHNYSMEDVECSDEESEPGDLADRPADDTDMDREHWTDIEFCEVSNPGYLHAFVEHFEGANYSNNEYSSRSPFWAKKVILQYSHESQAHFMSQLTSVLMKYGHHIWYCVIRIHDNYPLGGGYCAQLSQLLELMPNLRVLEIGYLREDPRWSFNVVRVFSAAYSDAEMSQMHHEVEVNPLPRLKDLYCLKIYHLPTLILDELIRKNKHIGMLMIHGDQSHVNYDVDEVTLPNLEELYITYCSEKDFYKLAYVSLFCFAVFYLYLFGLARYCSSWKSSGQSL